MLQMNTRDLPLDMTIQHILALPLDRIRQMLHLVFVPKLHSYESFKEASLSLPARIILRRSYATRVTNV